MSVIATRCGSNPEVIAAVADRPAAVAIRQKPQNVVVAAGLRGPPGIDGAALDPDPSNRLEARTKGLYVPPHEWEINQW